MNYLRLLREDFVLLRVALLRPALCVELLFELTRAERVLLE